MVQVLVVVASRLFQKLGLLLQLTQPFYYHVEFGVGCLDVSSVSSSSGLFRVSAVLKCYLVGPFNFMK